MDNHLPNDKNKSGFVSLHRKWLLTLSLLLLIMSATFGALNYWYLKVQVKAQQEASQAAWRAEFKGLIDHSIDRLQRLGIVLASLGNLTERLIKPDSSINSVELEEHFSSVRYELDVEKLMVFDNEGNIRWNWSPDSNNPVSLQPMTDIISRVKNAEKTEASLDCQAQCELYIVMPLLKKGKHVGYIGLSQRITDLVVEFSTVTGVDIGLLIPAVNLDEKALPRWRLHTAALTHAKTLRPLLEHLSERYASPADIPCGTGLPWREETYLFDAFPLTGIIKNATGYLVFISNVSEAALALKQSTRNSFLLMAFSLFFAEIFLFLFLRNPLLRIGHLAKTLPLVAQGNYLEAYKRLNRQGHLSGTSDEIDILYESSYDLTHQIEESQRALASDRDFIQGLLDSAEVMILTQTHAGEINTVNRYVSQLLGQSLENLKGRTFSDLIENNAGKEHYESNRNRLFSAALYRFEHEGSITDAKGVQRHIIWNHTYLGQTHNVAVLSVGMDATDRILAENRSRWLAHHDPLTGLANRLRFQEELERSFADSIRNGISTALLLLDLDYFKSVNDTSGHAAGDALLKTVANELRTRARKSDLVARLGGDEFAVLMPNTGRGGAEAFAESINMRLAECMFQFGDSKYQISASIGIALMPLHGGSVEELMINVDSAMYEAKKSGRGRWHFFSSPSDAPCYTEEKLD